MAALAIAFVLMSAGQNSSAQQTVPKPVDAEPSRWNTNWTFDDIDVGKLFSRLEFIGIEIPIEADGDVSVGFAVGVPIATPGDAKLYRLRGRVSAKRLRVEELLLEDFTADVIYDDGVLKLRDVKGRWTDVARASNDQQGDFVGGAELALVPRGDIHFDLKTRSLSLAPLYDVIVAATNRADATVIAGTLSGDIHFTSPLDTVKDPKTWNAKSDLTLSGFKVGDSLPLSVKTGPVIIDAGRLTVQDASMTSPLAPELLLNVAVQAELVDRGRFQFQLRGNDLPLAELSSYATTSSTSSTPAIAAGKLDIDASGQGELATMKWQINGRISSPELKLFGQNLGLIEHRIDFHDRSLTLAPLHPETSDAEMIVRDVVAEYQITDSAINVEKLNANIFGGALRGRVNVPREANGQYEFDLQWNDIHPVLNAARLLPFDRGGAEIKVSASTSGRVDWTVPARSWTRPDAHRGSVEIKLTDISVGKASVGEGEINLEANDETIKLTGDGKLFGGTFSVETTSSVQTDDTWSTLLRRIPSGSIKVDSAKLSQLAPLVRPDDGRRYAGAASAKVLLSPTDAGQADNQVVVEFGVDGLGINGRTLSRGIDGKVRLVGNSVIIDRASGVYAGGRIHANGRWSLGNGTRSVQVRFSGINASDAVLPVSETLAQRIAGDLSGIITVDGEQSYRIGGTIAARDSGLFSVATGSVHASVNGSFSSNLDRWQLKLASISGELAGGEIYGDANLSSSTGLADAFDLESRWNVRRVNFGRLISEAGVTTSLANGRITGSMSLDGKRIRGVADLTGRFAAELGQTDASAVPGLMKANRFLGAISLVETQFDRGEVNGTIGRGAFQINEFWLRSSQVRVFAEGRIGIADMRMDIDAVIATGLLELDNAKIIALAAQLAIESFIPIAAIVEINRLFSNRTVYFNVTGPASDPRLQLKPIETLRRGAARFLVREAMVLITTGTRVNN